MVSKKTTENMQHSASLSALRRHFQAITHLCWTCQ